MTTDLHAQLATLPDTDDLTDEQIDLIETLLANVNPDPTVREMAALRPRRCVCGRPIPQLEPGESYRDHKCGHRIVQRFKPQENRWP